MLSLMEIEQERESLHKRISEIFKIADADFKDHERDALDMAIELVRIVRRVQELQISIEATLECADVLQNTNCHGPH
jgi:ribonuclease I